MRCRQNGVITDVPGGDMEIDLREVRMREVASVRESTMTEPG